MVGDLVEEAVGFPTPAHDDQVDKMSQPLNRLGLQPLLGRAECSTGTTSTTTSPSFDQRVLSLRLAGRRAGR